MYTYPFKKGDLKLVPETVHIDFEVAVQTVFIQRCYLELRNNTAKYILVRSGLSA